MSPDGGESWRLFRKFEPTISVDRGEPVGDVLGDLKTYAYRNPFSPSRHGFTRIEYSLSLGGEVSIRIYDFSGKLVRVLLDGEWREGGMHHGENWDGRDDSGKIVANGVYFYRIEAGGRKAFGKIGILD